MLKNYAKELTALAVVFGLISYGVYVCAAPKQKEVLTATRADKVEPAKAAAPAPKKAAKEVKPVEVKKEHKKRPTLKKKYADKK